MKILLFGKTGQVGWELNRSLMPLGEIVALGRKEADFSRPEDLREVVRETKPDIIVNAAAYTAVDSAEQDAENAFRVNAESPRVLAGEAKVLSALLLHYSTDYVFDGEKTGPYLETDTPNPVNTYGRTKLAGELGIQSVGCDYLILRTSWVYSSRGKNFLLTILKLAGEKQELSIVDDQFGAPTWARNIADLTGYIIQATNCQRHNNRFSSGVYNIASEGAITWYEFARAIVQLGAGMGFLDGSAIEQVRPTSTEKYKTPAKRPRNSVLSTEKIRAHFGYAPIDWMRALECCIASMKPSPVHLPKSR